MRRLAGIAGRLLPAVVLALALGAPAVLAADPSGAQSGRVLLITRGDITVPAGEHDDAIVVVNGTATIAGQVDGILAVDSTLRIAGGTTDGIVAIRTPVTVEPGSVVRGDIVKLDSVVTQVGSAQVTGRIRDLGIDAAGLGFLLAPALVLLYVGFGIATLAAGLLLAGLAARQVRSAEAIISHEPLRALLVGLGGVVLPVVVIVVLFVSLVGAPLALGILLGLWPLTAFVGYLVAGIWVGDWLLARLQPGTERERPYLAAVVGLVVLAVLGVWPPLATIAGLFGFGAVLLLAWRTLRGTPAGVGTIGRPAAAPLPG